MNNIRVTTQKSKRQSSAGKAQAKKDELIAELLETRRKIHDLILTLSPAQHDQIFLGVWSIKDLVAHLIGWDATHQEAVKSVRSGKLPEFYAYEDPDWQTYNARLVSTYKRDSLAELIAAMQVSQQKLIDLLQTIPAEEFEQDTRVRFKNRKVTIARLLEAELEDEQLHYTQIKVFTQGP